MYIVGAEIRMEVGPTIRLEGRGRDGNKCSFRAERPATVVFYTHPSTSSFLLALNRSLQHFVTSHCANTNLMMALVIKTHCGERICNTRQEGKIGGAGQV